MQRGQGPMAIIHVADSVITLGSRIYTKKHHDLSTRPISGFRLISKIKTSWNDRIRVLDHTYNLIWTRECLFASQLQSRTSIFLHKKHFDNIYSKLSKSSWTPLNSNSHSSWMMGSLIDFNQPTFWRKFTHEPPELSRTHLYVMRKNH